MLLRLTESAGTVAAHRLRQQYGNGNDPENKKSTGANRLTFVFLGSPTWARTRDLRINSRALADFTGLPGIFRDAEKPL